MKKRIFIIGPNGSNDEDTLHIVARTTSRDSFLDIYQTDRYEEVSRVGNLGRAVGIAKRLGAKRVTVI